MKTKQLVKAHKAEKDSNVANRILLVIYILRDDMKNKRACHLLNKSESWGSKWFNRYRRDGLKGLRDKLRSGRPAKVPKYIKRKIFKIMRKAGSWDIDGAQEIIEEHTGVKYNLTYVRALMRKWGFAIKVPVGKHVRRPGHRRIKRYQRMMKKVIESLKEGYHLGVQDESIVIADSRLRRGVYTPKYRRAVFSYTGSHAKTIVFGFYGLEKEGFFKRYKSFTKDEFVDFLKEVHKKFGKIVLILDRAPQHTAKIVKKTVDEMNGDVRLIFQPPGCPDLNAIEEIWRQMKRAVLDHPVVKYKEMCEDIDKWCEESLPDLDIKKYLFRKNTLK